MEKTPLTTKTPRKSGTRPLSVILGTVMIPLSAIAAYAFVSPSPAVEDPAPAADSTVAVDPQLVFNPATATPEDLAAACGPSGLALVDAETRGEITDVQQAALDALREICGAQGLSLPGKAAPDPIVEQIVVQAKSTAPSSGSSTTTVATTDDSQYEDGSNDDSQYEDEYEDEDHEDEYEDEDHEDEDHGGEQEPGDGD
jgi:hypothetical protein